MSVDWKKILVVGGAAGAVAVLCYLLKEDRSRKSNVLKTPSSVVKSLNGDLTREEVVKILQEIIDSQDLMRGYLKEITKEFRSKAFTFEQTYARVKEVQPKDPLEQHDLSMAAFDQLLEEHKSEPEVREAMAKILGAPTPGKAASEKVQKISVNDIISVHRFMLKELTSLVDRFMMLPNRERYDIKTVTIAAQAMVGSRVEQEYGFNSEDIESAVLVHHTVLATSEDFASVNIEIQQAMCRLMNPV